MKIRLIPIETVAISTNKSDTELSALIIKTLNHRIGSTTKFVFLEASNSFIIERTLDGKGHTVIVANGIICNTEERRIIFMDITVREDKMFLLWIIFWYGVNLLFFLAFIFILIRDQEFKFFVLLPLLFIFLGYSFTTLTIQGAMDELITEIKKAVK